MNREYTTLIALAFVMACAIAGCVLGHLLLCFLGGLAIAASPFCIAFWTHRYWFSQLVRKSDLRLVTFHGVRGFRHYAHEPWWKYAETYDGAVADSSGEIAECWFSVSGPLFALIRPEMSFEICPEPFLGPDDEPPKP